MNTKTKNILIAAGVGLIGYMIGKKSATPDATTMNGLGDINSKRQARGAFARMDAQGDTWPKNKNGKRSRPRPKRRKKKR